MQTDGFTQVTADGRNKRLITAFDLSSPPSHAQTQPDCRCKGRNKAGNPTRLKEEEPHNRLTNPTRLQMQWTGNQFTCRSATRRLRCAPGGQPFACAAAHVRLPRRQPVWPCAAHAWHGGGEAVLRASAAWRWRAPPGVRPCPSAPLMPVRRMGTRLGSLGPVHAPEGGGGKERGREEGRQGEKFFWIGWLGRRQRWMDGWMG